MKNKLISMHFEYAAAIKELLWQVGSLATPFNMSMCHVLTNVHKTASQHYI